MSDDIVKRLRGKYNVGSNGIYEDRDFGMFTPKICDDAAGLIEKLQKENEELQNELTLATEIIEESGVDYDEVLEAKQLEE